MSVARAIEAISKVDGSKKGENQVSARTATQPKQDEDSAMRMSAERFE